MAELELNKIVGMIMENPELVEKIKYCDYLFKTDYFAQGDNLQAYQEKMRTLNGR